LSSGDTVREYDASSAPDPDLEDIAIGCGKYSRFRSDPRIPKSLCTELYRLWIRNSVSREFADSVLVSEEKGQISGLVTVLNDSGAGEIGLLGVGAKWRGRGTGKDLVHAALNWFLAQGCTTATVATQARNTAACRLYESAGFELRQADLYYHFWCDTRDSIQ
jgi:dTDP-4-amino-4,6-dideoxy-D-galactose acyltransferase